MELGVAGHTFGSYATPRLLDFLQNFHFHVMDVSVVGPRPAIPVISPVFGFSSITAPEMSIDVEEVRSGNWEFPHHINTGKVSVSPITFTRGVRYFDSNFWDWFVSAVKGKSERSRRRTLLLMQMANISALSATGALAGGALTASVVGSLANGIQTASTSAQNALIAGSLVGEPLISGWVPARTWILYDCIPTKYKSASDFDAKDSEISIAELEVQPVYWEEFNLGVL